MTVNSTETQTLSLTMAVADAVSDAVNARAAAESGVDLPPLVWIWNRGVYALPNAEQRDVEFRGRIAPDVDSRWVAHHLSMWASALELTECTTATEREHGRRTYTGLLAGSRIRISGRPDSPRPSV